MPDKDQIRAIIGEAVGELAEDNNLELGEVTDETRLYGAKSPFDSISLVTLIAEVEDRVGEAFDADLVLADERAMSQRNSPFRRVGTLVDYIFDLLQQEHSI